MKDGIHWCRCKCDCGNIVNIKHAYVVNSTVRSCGCLKRKYSLSNRRFIRIWDGIIRRVLDYTDKIYGGRGIKVCDRWLNFENFKEDMYESYLEHVKEYGEDNTSIDRIDVNGNYEPSNCRWATRKEQNNNRTNTLIFAGMPLTEYCNKYKIDINMVYSRRSKGWDFEDAVLIPKGIRRK